jgi:hypothetical protein
MHGMGFFICPSSQIPDWFTYQGEGASMRFKVHIVDNQILKGFVICIVYSIHAVVLPPYKSSASIINHTKNTIFTLSSKAGGTTIHRGDNMWVINVLTNNFEDGDEAELVFNLEATIIVKRLGIRLRYEGVVDGK